MIRARNLQRPVLVGWSYGGYVIEDYVRRFGDDELGGLVFVDAVTKNGTAEATASFTDEVLAIFGDVFSTEGANQHRRDACAHPHVRRTETQTVGDCVRQRDDGATGGAAGPVQSGP
ncbi:MAG: hypothetical protein ACREIV_08560 [Planctomycetaceae bacterium]